MYFGITAKKLLKKDDIETVNRIRISTTKEVSLLDAKILASNNHSSQFEVNLDEENNCVYLEFDYLDEKQGAVVQVIHTGSSSQDLEVIGDIKGVKFITHKGLTSKWVKLVKRFFPTTIGKKTVYSIKVLALFYFVLGALIIVYGVIYFSSIPLEILISSAFFIFASILLYIIPYRFLRGNSVVPKGLEIFYED